MRTACPRHRRARRAATFLGVAGLAGLAGAAPALAGAPERAPEPETIRAEEGDVVRFTITTSRPAPGMRVVLQRREGRSGPYRTVRRLRLKGDRVRAAVRMPRPGRFVFRVRLRRGGELTGSSLVIVEVAPDQGPRG